MGLFGKGKSDEYQNIESAATAPPLATATAIPVGKVAASAQTAPSSAGGIEFGRHPISIGACPYCNQPSTTRIKTYPSWETWVAAGILVLVFWPLCWVPLVTDTVRYYCVLYDFNQTLCTPIDIMYTHNCNYTFPAGQCKKTDHTCSQCEAMVGQVAPMSDCCVKRRG